MSSVLTTSPFLLAVGKVGTDDFIYLFLSRFEIINFQYGKEENLEGLLSHGNDVFNLALEADADVLMLGFLSKGKVT